MRFKPNVVREEYHTLLGIASFDGLEGVVAMYRLPNNERITNTAARELYDHYNRSFVDHKSRIIEGRLVGYTPERHYD